MYMCVVCVHLCMCVCMHMGIRRGLTYQWSVDPDFGGGGGHNWWVWLGWGHNPLVQLGWRGSTEGFQNTGLGICSPNNAQQRKVLFEASNTTSIWLLGNRTELLCVVLQGHGFHLGGSERYIGIHLCGVSSNLNRCTPRQYPPTINTIHRQVCSELTQAPPGGTDWWSVSRVLCYRLPGSYSHRLCGWTQEVTLCTLLKMPMIYVETQLQLFLRLGGWTQEVQIIITVCLHSMMVILCSTIE